MQVEKGPMFPHLLISKDFNLYTEVDGFESHVETFNLTPLTWSPEFRRVFNDHLNFRFDKPHSSFQIGSPY